MRPSPADFALAVALIVFGYAVLIAACYIATVLPH